MDLGPVLFRAENAESLKINQIRQGELNLNLLLKKTTFYFTKKWFLFVPHYYGHIKHFRAIWELASLSFYHHDHLDLSL